MHSYIQMNRQYALEKLQRQKQVAAGTRLEALPQPSAGCLVYPKNCTFGNYVDYMLVPTLVYEPSYPRTERVRPMYVLEKAIATLGMYLV
jgi:hypothetical protein